MYEKLKEMSTTPTHSPTFPTLLAIATSSGFTGSVIGNFADVVCLRMQMDAGLPPDQRRNYKNVADGLSKMIRAEGWMSIWKGVWLSAGRCAISTGIQLAGYDVIKRELMARTSMGDELPTHLTASCLAGFTSTFVLSPIDVIKTRLMTATQMHSIPVMLGRIIRHEGLSWMFKGLLPAFISRAPSTIITFLSFEQFKKAYRRMHDLEE